MGVKSLEELLSPVSSGVVLESLVIERDPVYYAGI
jgi:hypothetical protein